MNMEYIPKQEIACHDVISAEAIMEQLLENGYTVLMSREEDLYIINYIWSPNDADRNDVVYMDRGMYELSLYEAASEDEMYP